MEALIVVEGIVIVLLVVLVAGLLRSHGEILRQLDALGGGDHHDGHIAPPRRVKRAETATVLTGITPSGASATISLSGSRGHTLLAFLSTTCAACGAFWTDTTPSLEGVRPVVVTKGSKAESPAEVARLASRSISILMSTEAWETFAVPATPYFALVDNSNGRVIGEGSAPNWAQVEDMMRRAFADDRHAPNQSTGRSTWRSTSQRKADVDEELEAAGIEVGDPRLYQPPAGGVE